MRTLILSLVLIAQGATYYGLSRPEPVRASRKLAEFPAALGGWRSAGDGRVEIDIGADDYLTRDYARPDSGSASLFVAYFKSQRMGQTPHSPKNCLPGTGWVWTVSDNVRIAIADRAAPIEVNRYVVSRGEQKAVVLYWYQSRDRVLASEYRAAAFTAWDALRYNRTDTALVRIVVPIGPGGEQAATASGVQFVQAVFQPLRRFFPS